ncbi:MAG: alpha/beta hydrolase [Chloroflexota bacterium]
MLVEKTVDINGLAINYVEGSSNNHPVILLHGVTNRWQSFLSVLPLLGWRYHVFALDQRGHGLSGRGHSPYLSDKFAQDIISFLKQVVERPAIIAGHSLGAMIALKIAAQVDETLVKAIVLEDPPLFAAADDEVPTPPWFKQYHNLVTETNVFEDQLEQFAVISPELNNVSLRAQVTSLRQVDPALLLDGARDQIFPDFFISEVLPNIQCPALLIRGNPSLGGVIEEEHSLQAIHLLPKATHIFVPDMGHNLHREQPQRYFTLVSQFIETIL